VIGIRTVRRGTALLGLALVILLPARSAGAQTPASDRHVIVISLDGFAAYALADPALPLPNLRALARDGVMADAMLPVNPTVTWPNHTTLVTGVPPARHGLLYNGLPVRAAPGAAGPPIRIEPHVDKTTLVLAPTVYDLAYNAGLTTAQVDWVAIENAPTITWAFPEYSNPQAPLAREMVQAGAVSEAELQTFAKAPITFRDEIWTRAAEYIITAHKPNLLLFHLLTTDSMQHQYGARTLGAQTALVLADARVGRLIEACRQAGILPATTFVVVSDHGFKTFKRRIRINAVLKAHGLGDAAWGLSEGGTAMIYVTGPADRARTIAAVREAFADIDGVDRVLTPPEFAEYGFPSPDLLPRMADVVVAARDGVGFDAAADGEPVEDVAAGSNPGAHGYLNTDPDLRAIFIASGAGVAHGAALGIIRNLDVAPTIAAWLGLEMRDVDGHVLSGIVQAPASASAPAPAASR
jgi:predicted AlkP superfamily pyrophosphatase or phosphodiesterase